MEVKKPTAVGDLQEQRKHHDHREAWFKTYRAAIAGAAGRIATSASSVDKAEEMLKVAGGTATMLANAVHGKLDA